MLVKGILCICIQAILFKAVFTQCIGSTPSFGGSLFPANRPPVGGYNAAGLFPVAPIYGRVVGGNLIVDTSAQSTPTAPAGVFIFSDDLVIQGNVLVTGKLPFLGTVLLEGVVPAAGTSAVSHECGTGNIGIIEEVIAAPVTGPVLPINGAPCGASRFQ